MQNFFYSTFVSQDAEQAADAAIAANLPVELGLVELQQVGGGLGPAGTWIVASASTQGPAGTW